MKGYNQAQKGYDSLEEPIREEAEDESTPEITGANKHQVIPFLKTLRAAMVAYGIHSLYGGLGIRGANNAHMRCNTDVVDKDEIDRWIDNLQAGREANDDGEEQS